MNAKCVSSLGMCLLVSTVLFANTWTGSGPDCFWTTADNWDVGVPTSDTGSDIIGFDVSNGPIINDGILATAKNTNLKSGETGPVGTLTITGGQFQLGNGGPFSKVNPWNGNLWLGYFNAGETGKLDMSAGAVSCGYVMVGGSGDGILEMTGGEIDCFALEVIASNKSGGSGRVFLDGGTICAEQLNLQGNGIIDVNGGQLVIDGNAETIVTNYFNSGMITAAGTSDIDLLSIEYDPDAQTTMVALAQTEPQYPWDQLVELTENWLVSQYAVTAVEPDQQRRQLYYPLDAASGPIVEDISGNFFLGLLIDDDPDSAWSSDGVQNGCVQFDGENFISVDYAFDDITSEFTISCWLKHNDKQIPGDGTPLEYAAGDLAGTYDNLAWFDGDRQARPVLIPGTWYHYAFVRSCDELRIYHDGVLVARESVTVPLAAQSGETVIGGNWDDPNGFVGYMDELMVYDYALEHDEIIWLAQEQGLTQPLVPLLAPADPVADGKIDLLDFAQVANEWISEN